jgi:hypothetical protein
MQEATNRGSKESELFSRAGLDHPNQLERPREIGFFAHAISAAQRPQRGRRGPENTNRFARRAVGFGSLGLAHCPHPVSGSLPETRSYALMNSTGINVRYPACHGLNAGSVQCRRCAISASRSHSITWSARAINWLRRSFGQPGLPQSFFISREIVGPPRAQHGFEIGNTQDGIQSPQPSHGLMRLLRPSGHRIARGGDA